MSVGSLQLVRTWGLISLDSRQTKLQNVNFRQQNKGAFPGRGFLGGSSDVLASRSLLQDGYCPTLWQHIRAATSGPAQLSQTACCHTRASAAAVAEQSKKIAVSSARLAGLALLRMTSSIRNDPVLVQCLPAVALIAFSIWGLLPTMRFLRRLINKEDSRWASSRTQYVTASYVRPLILWIGVIVICRAFDPVILSSEASQAIKGRCINFLRSMSTVLAFAVCTARLTQHVQKAMMASQDKQRNLGVQFIGNTVYTSVWVAAVCLFMELLGFSTQRWITAGGFGTVLLTLAGREILTNFLSSIMIHATRPFIENEWIQTKIEGQEVSGTVEHVGWWSPTVIRGDDREAVHIPNHKFTVSVVRNLSQKTHWRIKTYFAVSHLDIGKITDIVADMRKVISKHPQVEQQRLHRRAFFDSIDPENQALMILISCFVKTSHFEEYLRVKELILLDMMRVIGHHNARLATPIRSVQRVLDETETRNAPFRDASPTNDRRRPTYMIEAKALSVNDSEDGDARFVDAGKESGGRETVKEMSSRDTGRGSKSAAPLKGQQLGDTDSKSKKKPKDKVQVANEAGLKSGPPSTADSSSAAKVHPVGLDSTGLNTTDVTLKSAFEKPPVDVPRGPVESAPRVVFALPEKDVHSDSSEQQKTVKLQDLSPSIASLSRDPVTLAEAEKATADLPRDDPWREQSQIAPESSQVAASRKSESPPGGTRFPDEKVQAGQLQGPASAVPRLQSVEENMVLGVALDGPKRTLPLDDDIPSPSKPRELVTSSRSSSSGAPAKDRRDLPLNSQLNPSGQGDSRDRER